MQEPSKHVVRQIALTSKTTMHEVMTSAAIDIYDNKRRRTRARALLDTCSTANFMTEKLATALRLPKRKLSIPVGVLNALSTTTKHVVPATIHSIHDGFEKTLNFLTIPSIAENMPAESIARESLGIPANIRLADPNFHKPAAVDLLIGSGPTLSMLCIGQIDLSAERTDLILQKTRLGWIYDNFSPDELECEEHFRKHVSRDETGRYIVALPFKANYTALGKSHANAAKRLNALEKRFKSDKELQQKYTAVIEEYIQLGHMSQSQQDNDSGFYLPHHAKNQATRPSFSAVFSDSLPYQLADAEGRRYPAAARILKRDLYVDDLLTGAPTIQEARELRDQMAELLKLGGLHLRQWASNDRRILEGLAEEELNHTFQLDKEQTLKTLGISWNATEDCIKYTVKTIAVGTTVTKRKILSEIAKIYDPLGLFGPIILYAKCLMQRLWLLKLDWDESVTHSIHTEWSTYCEQLSVLTNWSYERRILLPEATRIEMHGFCDASEKGYGACIYILSINESNKPQCSLLCSKSRVAPLKVLTVPRLELCAAQLLAKLYIQAQKTINTKIDETFLWTDSMITLHWINTSPHTLKTFVGNRVAEIQERTKTAKWLHVPSEDNPADQLSRGQLPREFIQNSLWNEGPSWLKDDESSWPTTCIKVPEEITERKRVQCFVSTTDCEILIRFSSFSKLRRVVAYCLRVRLNCRYNGNLKLEELNAAENKIIKLIQATAFKEEIDELTRGNQVNTKSKLKSLDPFVNEDEVLRVGGRLKNAKISYSQQHPAILPRSHHVTALIIEHYHHQNHHAGIQTTLYSIRQKYWLIDGRNQVRKVIRR